MSAYIQGVADVDGNMVVEIGWVARDHGFGMISLNNPRDKEKVEIDTETLGKQFVKNVLAKLVDDGKLIG